MPGKQVPLRRANPRRSGRVGCAGFVADLQDTVLSMELPGGLATIDPRHWRAHLPCSSGSNAELTVFLIVGQAKVGGWSFCVRTRSESAVRQPHGIEILAY